MKRERRIIALGRAYNGARTQPRTQKRFGRRRGQCPVEQLVPLGRERVPEET
jgi:hypothetical protein